MRILQRFLEKSLASVDDYAYMARGIGDIRFMALKRTNYNFLILPTLFEKTLRMRSVRDSHNAHFYSSGPNLSKSTFCHTTLLFPSSTKASREISLHFDPPSLYSRCVRSQLLTEIIRIHACGLSSYS